MKHRSLAIALVLGVLAHSASANPSREQTIAAYHELEQRLGVARNDPTTAFAVFMVGCYVAYSGAPIPADDRFAVLSKQVASHASALIDQAGTQRPQVIEYLATTGMSFVIQRSALEQRPDPRAKAELRTQAERVLAAMKVDPTTLVTSFGKFLQPDHDSNNRNNHDHAPAPGAGPSNTPSNTRGPDLTALRGQTVGVVTSYHRRFDGEYIHWDQRFHLLLKSGWATTKLPAVLDPGGVDGHRANHPKDWKRWRRGKKGVELCVQACNDARSWKPLHTEMGSASIQPILPRGFRFAGAFKSISGGTVGDTTALRYGFWTFEANGRFSTSSAGSVTTNSWRPGNGTTQIASGGRASKTATGTYEVDGVVLTLRFDDGRVVYRTIDAEHKPNPGSVTLDGTMYTRMK